MFAWLSALMFEAKPARGAQMTEFASVSAGVNLMEEIPQQAVTEGSATQQPAEVEGDQFRHEHERVTLRSESMERQRFVLSSRSYANRKFEDLVPERFRALVSEVADQFELDPRLLASVITLESDWDVKSLGTAEDTGLMQIIPGTARWIADSMGMKDYELFDPRTNLTMGAWYLHVLIKQHGNIDKALMEYNGGAKMAAEGTNSGYPRAIWKIYASHGKY